MPSQLLRKQARFMTMWSRLIAYAESLGYHVTSGETFNAAGTGHKPGSNHYLKLAGDLNLFDADWKYLTETKDHQRLGEYWEAMGGCWGGRFTNVKGGDGNHYSLEHEGRK